MGILLTRTGGLKKMMGFVFFVAKRAIFFVNGDALNF